MCIAYTLLGDESTYTQLVDTNCGKMASMWRDDKRMSQNGLVLLFRK